MNIDLKYDISMIETKRLILREITFDDKEILFQLHSDPLVQKWTGEPVVETMEEIMQSIRGRLHDYSTYGYGRLAVIEKQSDALTVTAVSEQKYRSHPRHTFQWYCSCCCSSRKEKVYTSLVRYTSCGDIVTIRNQPHCLLASTSTARSRHVVRGIACIESRHKRTWA